MNLFPIEVSAPISEEKRLIWVPIYNQLALLLWVREEAAPCAGAGGSKIAHLIVKKGKKRRRIFGSQSLL